MNSYLRQSTASQSRAIGPFLDDTDFKTPETGLTIANTDIKLVVNGGASANKNSGGGTHRVNGVYGVTFDATDTATVGEIEVSVVVSGALPVFHTFTVVEEAVYDALFAASAPGFVDGATVNATKVGGTTQTAYDIGASLGALNAAASSGDPGTTTTLVAYLKQIVNTLEGSAGIPTFPAAAVAGNAVSLAEVIRSIDTRLPSALGANGNLKADVRDLLGTAWLTPGTAGTPDVNVKLVGGTQVYPYEFAVSSAVNGTSVTLATLDAGNNTVPDDATNHPFDYHVFKVVGGTGIGQTFRTTTRSGVRQYGVVETLADALDATSRLLDLGTWAANTTHWGGTAVASAAVRSNVVQCGGSTVAAGAIPNAAAGAADGLWILGTNTAGAVIAPTSGHALKLQGGTSGGIGLFCAGGLGDGTGFYAVGSGVGAGFAADGGASGGHAVALTRGTAGADDLFLANSDAPTLRDAAWTGGTRVLTAGTNIQLPANGLANVTAWTVAITGNVTGNLSGSVGSVAGGVAGSVASVTSPVTITLTQAVTQRDVTGETTVDIAAALLAARAQGAGAWDISGTTLTLKNPDGTTFRTFTLDSAITPTARS